MKKLQKKKTQAPKRGFTLLEILLVIAAIGILAAIVIVAINPQRQLEQVRNAERQSDINTIQKALDQYLIDEGRYPSDLSNDYQDICTEGQTEECINLTNVLVPQYLAHIPEDPNGGVYRVAINPENGGISILVFIAESEQDIAINPISIIEEDLVLHLDAGNPESYPGTGTTWFDLSGNGNDGTLLNGVNFDSANGGSLIFDGIDDWGNIADFSDLAGKSSATISLWSNVNQSTGYHFWANGIFLLQIQSGGIYRLRLNLDGDWRSMYFTSFLSDVWHKIDITWDGVNTKMYIDGQERVNSIDDSVYNAFSNVTNRSLEISRRGNNFSNSSIREVRIYDDALSIAEIQQNFEATRHRYGL